MTVGGAILVMISLFWARFAHHRLAAHFRPGRGRQSSTGLDYYIWGCRSPGSGTTLSGINQS